MSEQGQNDYAKLADRLASRWKDANLVSSTGAMVHLTAEDLAFIDLALRHRAKFTRLQSELTASASREVALVEALKQSVTALDDWINVFASEHCDEVRVKEAHKRIMDRGGTLYYIATVQEQNHAALTAKA